MGDGEALRARLPGWARGAGWGAALLVTGIAGTAAGAGVGGAYLAGTGLSLTTVTGALIFVAGVTALVCGTVLLIRTLSRWWRLLAIPVALGLLVFVLYALTVAVIATTRPATALAAATPMTDGLPFRDLMLRTATESGCPAGTCHPATAPRC